MKNIITYTIISIIGIAAISWAMVAPNYEPNKRPNSKDFNYFVTWGDMGAYTNDIEVFDDGKIWFRGINRYDAGPPYDTLDMTLSGTYQIENLR